MEKPNIVTLGFEGSHRSGKGTQIELLSNKLESMGIPVLTIRGDGSRPNKGDDAGDPVSEWWSAALPKLRENDVDLEKWNESSYRLARELVVFRDRVLPRVCEQSGSNTAFLLVDRSILSRTMIPREIEEHPTPDSLYRKIPGSRGPEITPEKVSPDLIFNFLADPDVLISRLDINDPKYLIRKRNIENKANWYRDAEQFIPEILRDRIVEIDATKSPEDIHREIEAIIAQTVPEINLAVQNEGEPLLKSKDNNENI